MAGCVEECGRKVFTVMWVKSAQSRVYEEETLQSATIIHQLEYSILNPSTKEEHPS